MYSRKDVQKIVRGLFSEHWYRVLRLELLRRQTNKFYLSVLRRKYWIEGYIDDKGESRFHVLRKRKKSQRIRTSIYKNPHTFVSLSNAQNFIFAVTERKLNIEK